MIVWIKKVVNWCLCAVNVCLLAALITLPVVDELVCKQVRYTANGEKLMVQFSTDSTWMLDRVERIDLFCATAADPHMFSNPKLRVKVPIDKLPYIEAVVPDGSYAFRLEFVYKKEVNNKMVWPTIESMSVGSEDVLLRDRKQYFYKPTEKPSYDFRLHMTRKARYTRYVAWMLSLIIVGMGTVVLLYRRFKAVGGSI